jgi:hypothetical protein
MIRTSSMLLCGGVSIGGVGGPFCGERRWRRLPL